VFAVIGEFRPRWVQRANDAMDLPLPQARRVLDAVIAERRQRAAELRELAAHTDAADRRRRAYLGTADWVDASAALAEQIADRLAELEEDGQVATGREQMDRETRAGLLANHRARETDDRDRSRGWSR
jgi:hypothetical protein